MSYQAHKLPVLYYDESSINLWSNFMRIWQRPKDPIYHVVPNFRGSGCTIFGTICHVPDTTAYNDGETFDELHYKIV